MSLLDDLDLVEDGGARMDRESYIKEADTRIRAALLALESAQPEAELSKRVEQFPWELFEIIAVPGSGYEMAHGHEAVSRVWGLIARAREADAKTIAELRAEIAQMKDDAKHDAWEREEARP
jgi:hypothetical protein